MHSIMGPSVPSKININPSSSSTYPYNNSSANTLPNKPPVSPSSSSVSLKAAATAAAESIYIINNGASTESMSSMRGRSAMGVNRRSRTQTPSNPRSGSIPALNAERIKEASWLGQTVRPLGFILYCHACMHANVNDAMSIMLEKERGGERKGQRFLAIVG